MNALINIRNYEYDSILLITCVVKHEYEMSTSNFEYEQRFDDIKMRMNALINIRNYEYDSILLIIRVDKYEMSTSNFEYEQRLDDIEISMNAYKYWKL